jgi:hypothetical protein
MSPLLHSGTYNINMYIGLPDGIALFNRKERNRIHDTKFLYMHDYSRTVNVQSKEFNEIVFFGVLYSIQVHTMYIHVDSIAC